MSQRRTLSTLPPRPIRLSTFAKIAEHDQLVIALPLVPRNAGGVEVTKLLMIQTTTVGTVIEYSDAGWLDVERIHADGVTERELFERLVDSIIAIQQDTDGLLSAVLPNGRYVDLCDLRDVHLDRVKSGQRSS